MGSSVNSPAGDFTEANTDVDGDGFTALEDYLNFKANVNYLVTTDSTITVNVADMFKGYTASPKYTISQGNDNLQIAVNGSTVTVKPLKDKMIAEFTVKVTDSEGDSYERKIGVAVNTSYVSAIEGVETEDAELKAYEVYDMSGKLLKNGS